MSQILESCARSGRGLYGVYIPEDGNLGGDFSIMPTTGLLKRAVIPLSKNNESFLCAKYFSRLLKFKAEICTSCLGEVVETTREALFIIYSVMQLQ